MQLSKARSEIHITERKQKMAGFAIPLEEDYRRSGLCTVSHFNRFTRTPCGIRMHWNAKCSNFASYRHAIVSSAISKMPHEVQGGILADEMGLGKTITMLAQIVATRHVAESFATAERASTARFRTKSTLIVVPSARK